MNTQDLVDPSRAHSVADALSEEWSLNRLCRPYESHYWNPDHDAWPVLHLEDLTGIPFLDGVSGVVEYQHRARVRAGDGDLFAAGTAPAAGYEDYCREILSLGTPEFILAEGDDPMSVGKACLEDSAFERLRQQSADAGGLVIHPYMSIEAIWQLAHRLTEASGERVSVLGPPPPVLWVANDKARFSQLVEQTLGSAWIVETRRFCNPELLAGALSELAAQCNQVGLKRTRCASAMGNAVFAAEELRKLNPEQSQSLVEDFLTRTRWCDGEDVLVVQWRDTDISPSTQLWIPPKEEGEPILDGVYEQLLDGPEKVFMGSAPSTLPEPVNRALLDASLQVATALQHMGYVGRCSFDFIVTGDLEGDFHAQFTECNGRWGGTSTPMHLVDRLISYDGKRPPYVATDYYLPESHRGTTFADLVTALEGDLYSPATEQGRFILYNVGPLDEFGKFDVISLGDTPQQAQQGLDEVLPERLGI